VPLERRIVVERQPTAPNTPTTSRKLEIARNKKKKQKIIGGNCCWLQRDERPALVRRRRDRPTTRRATAVSTISHVYTSCVVEFVIIVIIVVVIMLHCFVDFEFSQTREPYATRGTIQTRIRNSYTLKLNNNNDIVMNNNNNNNKKQQTTSKSQYREHAQPNDRERQRAQSPHRRAHARAATSAPPRRAPAENLKFNI
jgi:hypothetical protein